MPGTLHNKLIWDSFFQCSSCCCCTEAVVGELAFDFCVFAKPFHRYTENLVNKNKTKHQTIQHINKGTKKISKNKKKYSAYHGGMSNNFSQYYEKSTHQIAFIVLRFSPRCDGTN